MARNLATVVMITKVTPIEGADRLAVAEMYEKGWRVVVNKDEFHVDDLAVFFEIDSFLPADDERYAFLKDRCLKKFVSKSGQVLREGIRIKSMRLRGVLSQGLLMPLHAFVWKEIFYENHPARPEDVVSEDGSPVTQEELEGIMMSTLFYWEKGEGENGVPVTRRVEIGIDDDLTELLHVEHYDEVKEQLQPQTGHATAADAMGRFPDEYIPETDEERIQNLRYFFEYEKDRKWQVSVKADGTSCTIAFSPTVDFDNPKVVCSRHLRLKRETATGAVSVYWQAAEKYDILNKLSELLLAGKEYAMQGEIVGPGIQSDRNKEQEYVFKCFRIWDIKNRKFLNPNETVAICKELDIPHVEVLETDFPFFDKITTMEDALKYAEGKTKEGNEREGVVLKTCDDGPYRSCKIISNRYLMKQED